MSAVAVVLMKGRIFSQFRLQDLGLGMFGFASTVPRSSVLNFSRKRSGSAPSGKRNTHCPKTYDPKSCSSSRQGKAGYQTSPDCEKKQFSREKKVKKRLNFAQGRFLGPPWAGQRGRSEKASQRRFSKNVL